MNSTATSFLRALVPELETDWLLELRYKEAQGQVRQRFFRSTDEAASAGLALRGSDVWFGVGPRLRFRGTREDVARLGATWADVDFKVFTDGEEGAARSLAEFPLEPSLVVASGGGFQAYWLLNEMADSDYFSRIEAVNKGLTVALAPNGRTLDPAIDAARVLRLPGTLNHKYDPPRPVLIRKLLPDLRYGITDLEDVLPEGNSHPAGSRLGHPPPAERIPEGSRNTYLTSLAGTMRRRGMTEHEILAALSAVNTSRCEPPLTDAEVTRIAASVARYSPLPPLSPIARRARLRARRFA